MSHTTSAYKNVSLGEFVFKVESNFLQLINHFLFYFRNEAFPQIRNAGSKYLISNLIFEEFFLRLSFESIARISN
jgi:hypothetical protein